MSSRSSPERSTSPRSPRPPSKRFLKAFLETTAANCHVHGDGLSKATVRQPATFQIEAYDEHNERRGTGGDAFFIAVRGGSKVRAHLTDNDDGTYVVKYCPSVSGKYTITVSLFGVSLPGSPWPLEVISPQPSAERCLLKGDALTSVVARTPSSFEVRFRDAFGAVATAEELDVFVERRASDAEREAAPELARLDEDVSAGDGSGSPPSSPWPSPWSSPWPSPGGGGGGGGGGGDGGGGGGGGGSGKSRRGEKIPKELSYLRQRVEVGPKPLIVRAGVETTSPLVGTLPQGVLMKVLEERLTQWANPLGSGSHSA